MQCRNDKIGHCMTLLASSSYWAPAMEASLQSMLDLSKDELFGLSLMELECDYRVERGKKGGYTPCGHYKKLSVVRGKWRSTLPLSRCQTPRA